MQRKPRPLGTGWEDGMGWGDYHARALALPPLQRWGDNLRNTIPPPPDKQFDQSFSKEPVEYPIFGNFGVRAMALWLSPCEDERDDMAPRTKRSDHP